ncbi:MAG: DUF3638 domain-containing protein [Chlamydiota bacterium]
MKIFDTNHSFTNLHLKSIQKSASQPKIFNKKIASRVKAAALPIFAALDIAYHTLGASISFTAFAITLGTLQKFEPTKEHLLEVARSVAHLFITSPLVLLNPQLAQKALPSDQQQSITTKRSSTPSARTHSSSAPAPASKPLVQAALSKPASGELGRTVEEFEEVEEPPETPREDPFRVFDLAIDQYAPSEATPISYEGACSYYRSRESEISADTFSQSLDMRMVGHILGDHVITESGLEGSTLGETLSFFANYLDISPTLQEHDQSQNVLKKQFEKALAIHQQYKSASSTPIDVAKHIIDEIRKNPTEELLIPSGWSKKPLGHAMLLKVKKESDGNYSLYVYNTGAGLEYHPSETLHGDFRYEPIIKYGHLSEEEICDQQFWTAISELQTIYYTARDERKNRISATTIYGNLLSRFSKKKVDTEGSEKLLIAPQKAGTCAFRSPELYLRAFLGNKKLYKQYRLGLKLQTLIAMKNKIEGGDHREDIEAAKTLFHAGLENISRQVLRWWHPNHPTESLLDFEDVQRAHVIISELKKAIPLPGEQQAEVYPQKIDLNDQNIAINFSRAIPNIRIENPPKTASIKSPSAPLPLKITAPQTSAEACRLLEQATTQCREWIKDKHTKTTLHYASEVLIALPLQDDQSSSLWGAMTREYQESALKNLSTLSNLLTRATLDNCPEKEVGMSDKLRSQQPARCLLANAKAYCLGDQLTCMLDPALQQYPINDEVLSKFNEPGCVLTSQYETILKELQTYTHRRNQNTFSTSRSLFDYEVSHTGTGLEYTISPPEEDPLNADQYYITQACQHLSEDEREKVITDYFTWGYTDLSEEQKIILWAFEGKASFLQPYYQLRELALNASSGWSNFIEQYSSSDNNVEVSIDDRKPAAYLKYKANRYFGAIPNKPSTPLPHSDKNYFGGFDKNLYFKGLESENEVSKDDTYLQLSRALGFAATEKNLTLPILINTLSQSHLLNSLGSEPTMREMLFYRLFQPEALRQTLIDQPELAGELINLCQRGIEHFSIKKSPPELQPALFFAEIALRAIPYFEENGQVTINLVDVCEDIRKHLRNLPTDKKCDIDLLLAYSYSQELIYHDSSDDNVYLNLLEHYMRSKNDQTPQNLQNPLLIDEVEHIIYTRFPEYETIFHDSPQARNKMAARLLQLTDSCHDLQTVSFNAPIFNITDKGGKQYYFNCANGDISSEHGRIVPIPQRFKDRIRGYKLLFGDYTFQNGSLEGDFYRVDDPQFGELAFGYGRVYKKYDDKWYCYIPDTSGITIPKVLKAKIDDNMAFCCWIQASPQKTLLASTNYSVTSPLNMIICNKADKTPLLEYDGYTIYDRLPWHPNKELVLANLEQLPPALAPLRNFTDWANNALVSVSVPETEDLSDTSSSGDSLWSSDSDLDYDSDSDIAVNYPIEEINFPLYYDSHGHLRFYRNDDKLVWSEDPNYFIKEDQSMDTLGPSFDSYILLENAAGEQKVLIPSVEVDRQTTKFSKDLKLQTQKFIKATYHTYDLKPSGNLEGNTPEGALFLSYCFLAKRDYEQALYYLQRASSLEPYNQEALSIINRILALPSQTFDNTAPAQSVLLYAGYLATTNLRDTMTSEEQQRAVQEKRDEIFTLIHNTCASYLKNRKNCPIHLQLSKLINSTDAEFAFFYDLIKAAEKNPQLTPSPQILLYLQRFSHKTSPFSLPKVDPITQWANSIPRNHFYLHKEYDYDLKNTYSPEFCNLFFYSDSPKPPQYYLMPSHEEFRRNFQDYYRRATSDDPQTRIDLHNELIGTIFHGQRAKQDFKIQNAIIVWLIYISDPNTPKDYPKLDDLLADKQKAKELSVRVVNQDLASQNIDGYLNSLKTPGALSIGSSIDEIAQERKERRQGRTWPQAPHKDTRKVDLKLEEKLSFSYTAPLKELSQQYFEHQKAGKQDDPLTLVDETRLQHLPQYIKDRVGALQAEYEQGHSFHAEQLQYSLLDAQQLQDLGSTITREIQQDQDEATVLEQRIITLANKKSPYNAHHIKNDLLITGKVKSTLSLEECISLFASNDTNLFIDENPALQEHEAYELIQQIGQYLIHATRRQQLQRSQAQLQELSYTETSSPKYHTLVQKLGQTLDGQRVYDINQWRELLVFEYRSDKMLWKEQFGLIEKMFEKAEDKEQYRDVILQLIMGGGKTDVINIIQAQKKANGDDLAMLVVLPSLFNTNKNDLKRKSQEYGQETITLEFGRAPFYFTEDYLYSLYGKLLNARSKKYNVITPPETLHCLRLKYYETLDQLAKNPNNADLQNKKGWLRQILLLIDRKGNATFDEPHVHFNCRQEFNFPCGQPQKLDHHETSLMTDVMRMIATDFSDIVPLRRGEQHLLTSARYHNNFKPLLAEKLISRLNVRLPQKASRQIIPYLCGAEKSQIEGILKTLDRWSRGTKEQREAADLLALSKHLLTTLLPECLIAKEVDVHYGLSIEEPNLGIAIPYSAARRPAENSRIADQREMTIKTLATYYQKGLSLQQTRRWLELCKTQAIQELESSPNIEKIEDTPAAQTVKKLGFDLLTVDLSDTETIAKISNAIKDPTNPLGLEIINQYLKEVVFPTVEVFPEQLNSNSQDLASTPHVSQGYSGTVENRKTFHERFQTYPTTGTNGRTIDLLLKKKTPLRTLSAKDPQAFLEEYYRGANQQEDIHAIIDVGAHFTDYDNETTARQYLKFFQGRTNSSIKGVIFFQGDQLAMLNERNEIITLPGSDSKSVFDATGYKPEEYIAYFDQAHTTGTDLPLHWQTKALTTLGLKTTTTQLFQGINRLRGLKEKMSTELVIPEQLKKTIADKVNKNPDELDIIDIILYVEINESEEQMEHNFKSCLQKMEHVIKQRIHAKLIASSKANIDVEIFQEFRSLFITALEASAYKKFGQPFEKLAALKVLEDHRNRLLQTIENKISQEEYRKIDEELGRIIESYKDSIPEEVVKPQASEMNQTVEQQVEQHRQQEQQEEVQRQYRRYHYKRPAPKFSWPEDTLTNPQWLQPSPMRDIDSLNPNNPRLFRLQDVLQQNLATVHSNKGVFDKNILVSEGLLKTFKEERFSLLNPYAKNSYSMLAVKDGDSWQFVLLSVHDAAFFKEKILQAKKDGKDTVPQMWLMTPTGKVLQRAKSSLDSKAEENPSFQRGLVQTMVATGAVAELKKYHAAFKRWALEGDKKAKKEVLKQAVEIHNPDSFATYCAIAKVFDTQ